MLVAVPAAALMIFSVIVVSAAFMTVCMPIASATLVILCVIVSVSAAALVSLVMAVSAAAAVRTLRLAGKNFVCRRFAVLDDFYVKFQLLAREWMVKVYGNILLADSFDAHAGSRAVLRLTEKLHAHRQIDARELLFRQDLHGVLLILADPVARAYANRFALARL